MPGMMETILDIGLNDTTVAGLARQSSDERFAWDSHRRLIQMFGRTVFDMPGADFENELAHARDAAGAGSDAELGAAQLRDVVAAYKKVLQAHTGRDFPQASPGNAVHSARRGRRCRPRPGPHPLRHRQHGRTRS